jgi:hypothetical protein
MTHAKCTKTCKKPGNMHICRLIMQIRKMHKCIKTVHKEEKNGKIFFDEGTGVFI